MRPCAADAFERLPEGISSLRQLVDLQLYRCGVLALPATICELESLGTLLVEGAIQGVDGSKFRASGTLRIRMVSFTILMSFWWNVD